jgi:NADPH-dependent 2,4-dienoyl-CoA reductase/sulfur reductase-like enzyme
MMVRMDEAIRTRCCIAGGGPAGMMLALLLARMGEEDNTTNGRNYWDGMESSPPIRELLSIGR